MDRRRRVAASARTQLPSAAASSNNLAATRDCTTAGMPTTPTAEHNTSQPHHAIPANIQGARSHAQAR